MRPNPQAVEEALGVVLSATPLELQIKGRRLSLAQRWLYLCEYAGSSPKNALGKPIVGTPDRPFAELQVVTRLEHQGWIASWLHGPGEFISSWEPREEAQPSRSAKTVLERIDARAGRNASHWNVMAWKPELRFIHIERAGSSVTIPPSKLKWFEAAIAEDVPSTTFEIWRWFGGELKGRRLRLGFYTFDRLDGWVEWRNGQLSYSDGRNCDEIVEYYRNWGARTEADLLWLVFVHNISGLTWCGIEECEATQ